MKLKAVEDNQKKEMELLMKRQKDELGKLQGEFASMLDSATVSGGDDAVPQSKAGRKATMSLEADQQGRNGSGGVHYVDPHYSANREVR